MMRTLLLFVILLCHSSGYSQREKIDAFRDSLFEKTRDSQNRSIFQHYTDSLYGVLNNTSNDTIRVAVMLELCNNYKYKKPDSAVFFARKTIELARVLNMHDEEGWALTYYLLTESAIGNDAKALQLALEIIRLGEVYNLPFRRAIGTLLLGWTYNRTYKYERAIINYRKALRFFESAGDETYASMQSAYLAETYSILGKRDSALYFIESAEKYTGRAIWSIPYVTLHIGKVYANFGNQREALHYLQEARISSSPTEAYWEFEATKEIVHVYNASHDLDSALYYAQTALSLAERNRFHASIIDANLLLAQLFEKFDKNKALIFLQTAFQYKDSLSQMERSMAIEDFLNIDQKQRQQELETAKRDYQSQLKMNALLGSSFTLLVVAVVLYRSQRLKQRSKKKIEEAYHQLKSTQSQLIQSEKMASLGELTAGIAHEIQNPLNFVNNFSEVNKELAQELEQEIEKGNSTEAKALAKDIKANQDKILHHGKRADAIVKGMLQHSRTNSGQKEPTNINTLCDEYLRLAYHGLRAKDKTFNARIETDFDSTLTKINVIPQDIGRVVLNLINNGFYSVSEKCKQQPNDYEPAVSVSTKKSGDNVLISVRDNGNGIPDSIKEKIFQPFFTTKPTGQGTGLGLSLTYDIVKAHGGELTVETKEGEGSEFVVSLPV
jgi:two-component system NtrC family sensor kinase